MVAYTLIIAFAALSSVSALVVPRVSPSNWPADFESYDIYRERYISLECKDKRGQPFFDLCCRPHSANENVENTQPFQCISSPDHEKITSDLAPTPTDSNDEVTPTIQFVDVAFATEVPASNAAAFEAAVSGGFATFYYQNGVAGACGAVHGDYDLIAAMDYRRYGNVNAKSDLCGKWVKITNPANGKSVTVTIADACPTCNNGDSIDLSVGAFQQIAPLEQGLVPIQWTFV